MGNYPAPAEASSGHAGVAPASINLLFPLRRMSGWHKRVQEMIRYFGSRYQVTLVAPAAPELPRHVRKEALRYLHMVRGVEGGCPASEPEDFPYRVRQLYVDSVQAALRALPTGHYHAALIDQIFLANFATTSKRCPC